MVLRNRVSALPPTFPCVAKFSWNWVNTFFGNLAYYTVRGPSVVICDRARFFGKNPYRVKLTNNGQKWPKNRVLELFKKMMSLVLSGICIKWKFVRFVNISWQLHAWTKTWFSSYSQKWLSANEISVFFNRQCCSNRLIFTLMCWKDFLKFCTMKRANS